MPILFMGVLALITFLAIVGLCIAAVMAESRTRQKNAAADMPLPESPAQQMAKAAGQGR